MADPTDEELRQALEASQQANAALGNQLGGPAPVDPRLQKLRADVVKLLKSNRLIFYFHVENIAIDGRNYATVAQYIEQGRIEIVIRPGKDPEYDSNHTPARLFLNVGELPEGKKGADAQGSVVHEATHAMLDIVLKGSSRPFLTDEACAWIAQAVFAKKAGHGFPTHNDFVAKLSAIADAIIALNANRKWATVAPSWVNALKSMMALAYSARKKTQIDNSTMSKYGGP